MNLDFILNGQATGSVASKLMANNFNVHCLRPFIGEDGREYVTVNEGGILKAVPTMNSNASLRKDDWLMLDTAIVKAARSRLKAVADLRSAGLTFTVPNGMGKTVLETETQSDVDPAIVSMDGLAVAANDRPQFGLSGLPLPIIHKDFSFSARQIQASRNGGSPLDTATAEASARRVAEEAEKMLLGNSTVADLFKYGGYTIYGYTDHPSRLTKTITSPTASGWTPVTTLNEVLAMRDQAKAAYHYGPYWLYVGSSWDKYLDADFSANYPGVTLRDRLLKCENIGKCQSLDFLSGYTMILVQATTDVVREVIGMDVTTVQWESHGGMQVNFKVMAIMVPQLRADYNGNMGIVHGSV